MKTSMLSAQGVLLTRAIPCALVMWTSTASFAQTVPTAGLVGYWRGENNANDSHSTPNGGTFTGGSYVAGAVGNAFSITSGNYVSIPDILAYDFSTSTGTDAFTFAVWFNMNSLNTSTTLANFAGQDGGSGSTVKWMINYNYGLSNPNGRFNFMFGPGGGGAETWLYSDPAAISQNTWYHLALTKDTTTYTFYLNGTAIGAPVSSNAFPNPTAPFTLGYTEVNLAFVGGSLDEALLYNRALAPSEISGLAAIPEPTTYAALIGLGALALAARRWRRSAKPEQVNPTANERELTRM